MDLFIRNSSEDPIYRQIYDQIKVQILKGSLQEAEALPSIRNLAKDLHISVITTKRAYMELENDGFIHTIPGKGSFVAKTNQEFLKEIYFKDIEEHMEAIVRLAHLGDIKTGVIFKMLKAIFEEVGYERHCD